VHAKHQHFGTGADHRSGEKSESMRTFSTLSKIDSSLAEASFLMAKNAAIRMLSCALDHNSRHF
jgi:hypothetical protein